MRRRLELLADRGEPAGERRIARAEAPGSAEAESQAETRLTESRCFSESGARSAYQFSSDTRAGSSPAGGSLALIVRRHVLRSERESSAGAGQMRNSQICQPSDST